MYVSNRFHSQSEQITYHHPSMLFSVDVHEIKPDIDSFIEKMNYMKKAYMHELFNPSIDEQEDDPVVQLKINLGGSESNMVGLFPLFITIKDRLIKMVYMMKRAYIHELPSPLSDLFVRIKDRLNSSQSDGWMFFSLCGMAGIGKTTIANKLFQYPFFTRRYSWYLFVTIGPKYQLVDILVDILTQVNVEIHKIMGMKGDKLLAELKRMVTISLKYSRYLIVLDDVWDIELFSELVKLFPDDKKESRVLVTTRLDEVARFANPLNAFLIPFLDNRGSWYLLREKVFGEESPCPPQLEKAGKEIAKNCEGLPLTIVTVANIMSKANKTIEYWNEVAANKHHPIFVNSYDQMSKVLYPSYDYLDQHLKACVLYVGAFPQNYWVHLYRLINLWSDEGFLDPEPIHRYSYPTMTFTNGTYHYLDELFTRNVIMNNRETLEYHLHSSFWYLCNKEATKNKFFYALNRHTDALPKEVISSQHRLCIRNSILFAIKDVQNSITSASKVRSRLCTGPFHPYPVPFCLKHLRLLRVLHTLSIRFYEFPMEVLKLVQLRHLALVYDEKLPTAISKLWNLQNLIVNQYSFIKSVGNLSYLPIEVWDMNELKSLETIGKDLPRPCEGSLLPNLLKLVGVSPQSCTKDVFKRMPNLKALAIQIELAPDATEPLSCFKHIFHLHELEFLECYNKNPILQTIAPLSGFPSSLTTLMLSGLGYPWEEMSKISSLPNLLRLKLKCYAFQGPKWEIHDNEFKNLSHFEIEDTDLVQWKFVTLNSCLPAIRLLRIAHCYKLKEMPLTFGSSLQIMQLLDCSSTTVNCANKLKQEWDDKYGDGKCSLLLDVYSSWDDRNTQS